MVVFFQIGNLRMHFWRCLSDSRTTGVGKIVSSGGSEIRQIRPSWGEKFHMAFQVPFFARGALMPGMAWEFHNIT